MFSMFRFLMGDKSVVCRIIRLLILILTIYVSYVLTHMTYDTKVMSEFLHREGGRYWTTIDGARQLYRRIECKMCFEVIEKLKEL